MRWLNGITLALLIVGGLNWGLVALGGYEMDLVANLFGGPDSGLSRIVYALVGLSAIWQIVAWVRNASAARSLNDGRDTATFRS